MSNDEPIKCPRCLSTQIHVDKKGFKTGRAVVGGLLTGNILMSAAIGAAGMNKIELTCLKCGHKFKVGEDYESTKYNNRTIEPVKPLPTGVRVLSAQEVEHPKQYKCECGKVSSLTSNHPRCPKCGRTLSEKHIFQQADKGGCLPMMLNFNCQCNTGESQS